MVTEIELKAHVHNNEDLRFLLSEKAEYLYAFEKEDSYWEPCWVSDLPAYGLRVRRERRKFVDGNEESSTLVTYKTKEVREGIEINNEREFFVDPAHFFEEFLRRLRFKPGIFKQKNGWAYTREGIRAELLEVPELGWFLELEIIKDSAEDGRNREESFAKGKKRLLDFLTGFGIEKEAVESRYYSQMLKESDQQSTY
jgi:adenylate cyclase class 2